MKLENKTLFKIALIVIIFGAVLNIFTLIIKAKPLQPAAVFVSEPSGFQKVEQDNINSSNISIVEEDNLVALMFVGDMMLSRSVGKKMKKLDNWQWPFEKIAEYLSSADLTFGNLEGPISDKGRNVGSIYSFRADPRVIQGLKYASFDILSLANNHIGD